MLAPALQVSVSPRLARTRETGFVPLPVSRLQVPATVFNALAEGRLTALVVDTKMVNLPGHMLAVFNQRQPKSKPLELVMGRPQEDGFGLERGYRILPVGLLSQPVPLAEPDEPTKYFTSSTFRSGHAFISSAPGLHERIGRPMLDGSTIAICEPPTLVDGKEVPGAVRTVRAAVMGKYDMPGIAAHARLITVPRAG